MLTRRWFPWKQLVKLMARSRGFVDPITLLARLEGFGQPLEIREPLELLRSGVVFHARGLINTGAIQHNLDWVWPYWVERQYNPYDDAFIPRSFSITHINLTHRNWTAVGLPGFDELPIVDPRGLVMPFWDGWSLDTWLFTEDGTRLFPSRQNAVEQFLETDAGVAIVTVTGDSGRHIFSRVTMELLDDEQPGCIIELSAVLPSGGCLIVALRPYNPEGISFIHDISTLPDKKGWLVNNAQQVKFSRIPDRLHYSYYRQGDVSRQLFETTEQSEIHCRVGMATAAALFQAEGGVTGLRLTVPFPVTKHRRSVGPLADWDKALAGSARVEVPDALFVYLYDAAIRSLILHSPGDIYPGAFTYKRFWFRDAVFILTALLSAGLTDRVGDLLESFPDRQQPSGFFHSQEGEWDSNGEVLWLMQRYSSLVGTPPSRESWLRAIRKGARWIVRKRLAGDIATPFAGLLPAGFSAEHLGPNDYYYWDDFWGFAGLQAAAQYLLQAGDLENARFFQREADDFWSCIQQSLSLVSKRIGHPGMPASPYRRMDPGAIGSLVAGYPLQLFAPTDTRLLATANFLVERCMVQGGFFQDVIHSGINPYLTLHIAQVLLRAGDSRALDLIRSVARFATPTGQWPEAIHPRTLGGCMGDGHHVWASAEWVNMLRNCFIREEGNALVLGSGLFPSWLEQRRALTFGPSPTPFGPISVTVQPEPERINVSWQGEWRGKEPLITIALPSFESTAAQPGSSSMTVLRRYRL